MKALDINSTVVIRVPLEQSFTMDISKHLPCNFEQWSLKRQRSFISGRSALYSYCAKFLPLNSLGKLLVEEHGKPYFANRLIEFNISHSKDMLYLMLSPKPIGIDVEEVKARRSFAALKAKILNPEEIEFLKQAPAGELSCFFWLWTIKEALVKLTGRGLAGLGEFTLYPRHKQILHPTLTGSCYSFDEGSRILSFYLPASITLEEVVFLEYVGQTDEFKKIPKPSPDMCLTISSRPL